ncbi:S1C family serine protease [Actinomadura xylanilytica]|uniref:S1C family serine protease n=1 Tax=Actinomadura xylanilytica TaxID=887459 RepID=UPI00255ACFF6|nr:trypsin-like peptidase domain-containing protein [Actinomadura xylanilytica]MDL4771280.1 trypsin-like peptidase domain-containing protein [Actinomadura xylanilytica]
MRCDTGVRAGAAGAAGTLALALALAGCGNEDTGTGKSGGSPPVRPASSAPASPSAASTSSTSSGPDAAAAGEVEQQFEKVVDAVLPSVVKIQTDQGEGSGVVFDGAGHVVTNAHVVAGAKRIEVTAASGGAPLKAALVGDFAADDLAVVEVTGGSLKPAAFADSSKVRVGRMVLAMGNPLGLSGSVTNGIVSALNRTVSTKREGAFPGATIGNVIQTSAAINPGNSGGALVTLDGQVIGIPTAAASDPQMGGAAVGIGFATPSNTVKQIVPQLIRSGKVTDSGRAALGVVVRTVIDPRSGAESAVAVVEVTRGGGAAKAGVVPGDLIMSVDGTPTPSQTELAEVLAGLKPGGRAKLEIQTADGARKTVEVALGQLPGGG